MKLLPPEPPKGHFFRVRRSRATKYPDRVFVELRKQGIFVSKLMDDQSAHVTETVPAMHELLARHAERAVYAKTFAEVLGDYLPKRP